MAHDIHFEIQADEPGRAVDFYRGVFNWEIEKSDGPVEWWLVSAGAEGPPEMRGAILQRATREKGCAANAFVCTIDVPDLDHYLHRVQEQGGELAVAKLTVPQVGWLAYCTDPDGNVFGMVQSDPASA